MNTALHIPTTQSSNPIQAAKVAKFVALAFLVGTLGLAYVYLKNQQFMLAEQIRKTERQIRDVQSRNEVLVARVTELCSRPMLQTRRGKIHQRRCDFGRQNRAPHASRHSHG